MKKLPTKRLFVTLTSLLVILSIAIYSPTRLAAQENEQTVSFRTPSIELVFQPPLRSGLNSENPSSITVPRINLLVNLFENYLQYLGKLQKIATGTSLRLVYAPDKAIDDSIDSHKLLRIRETGLNSCLTQVNQFLKDHGNNDTTYFLESAESLFSIPDQLPRATSKIALRTEMINHSCFQKSLEPDTDFCVIDDNRVITARPFQRSNRLFLMTDADNTCQSELILKQASTWYADLSASSDGRFLACSDGMRPLIKPMNASESEQLFENSNQMLLTMNWSPQKPWLAGLLLNNLTQERSFFIYDAERAAMLETGARQLAEEANYINPYICWSPDGNRLLLTSARSVHLLDFAKDKVQMHIVRVPNDIAEITWSDDSESFALVEVIGQARQRYIFDDLDYRKCILHRYRIKSDYTAAEDHAQRVESRNTIKLVSFWTNDRVLYLEGRLISKRLNTPFWDLSQTFSAHLTAGPSTSGKREASANELIGTASVLPMQYLYVFRNLDSKFKNIYDAGFNHSNHLYTDKFENIWFIGLRRPEEISQQQNVYNHRQAPYPFPENNVAVFSDISASKMLKLLKFFEEYNLRLLRFNSDVTRIFMLANFTGPLNLWSGDLRKMVEGLNNTEN